MSTETVKIFKCDRCERTAEHYNTIGCHKSLGVTWLGWFQKKDVCKMCYEEFFQWWCGAKFPPKEAK